jgi:transcription antitermination factor NusA-like protein
MVSIIDMQHMRYINLFEKVTKVSTRFCFNYNETIFFCVPRNMVSRSIGDGARNIKKLNEILGRKIKVIPLPKGISDARIFIGNIVSPVMFKGLEVKGDEIILNASTQSKAALIGRNKRRLIEMQKIVNDFFRKEFKIV